MLCGRDDQVKPDRMVLRWLTDKGLSLGPNGARSALRQLAAEVALELCRPVTPRMVDHAIWLTASPARRGGVRHVRKDPPKPAPQAARDALT
jgi:hypothetical protein